MAFSHDTTVLEQNLRRIDDRAIEDGASFSGHERNAFFLNTGGDYAGVSSLAGMDHSGDSRSFAYLDYDHDGWLDVVQVNANAPLTQLFHNDIGKSSNSKHIAIQLVGGNRTAEPVAGLSNRDGIGARVFAVIGGKEVLRELRAGDGFAAQNTKTLLLGLGDADHVESLRVVWPSGRVQTFGRIDAGAAVTIHEVPEHAAAFVPADSGLLSWARLADSRLPSGGGFIRVNNPAPAAPATNDGLSIKAYGAAAPAKPGGSDSPGSQRFIPDRIRAAHEQARPDLIMYTAMAAWCVACRKEVPELVELRDAFGENEMALYGLPTDPDESIDTLNAWMQKHQPPYALLTDISADDQALFKELLISQLKFEGLPATMVTDGDGEVVLIRWGPPTVSELRKLLWQAKN